MTGKILALKKHKQVEKNFSSRRVDPRRGNPGLFPKNPKKSLCQEASQLLVKYFLGLILSSPSMV